MITHAASTFEVTTWEEKPYGESEVGPKLTHAHVVGKIAGRSGSFVLEHTGTDASNETKDASTIVPGSGTGEFSNLRGTGNFTATREAYPFLFTLDYEFI